MSEEAPKLRLRPKLNPDPAPATSGAAPDTSAPASTIAPEPAAAAPTLTLNLRPAPGAAATVSTHAPALVPPAAAVATPETSAEEVPLAERAKRVHRAALLIAASGAVLFGVVSLVAFPRLIARQLKEDESAQRLDALLEQARRTESADKPAATPAAPAKAETIANTPAPSPAIPATSDAKVAEPRPQPASLAISAPPEVSAEPSTHFRSWVQNVKITGLRTGTNPRLLVNGAAFNVGDTLNAELGIVFDGYDAQRRVLRFKDASGQVVERRHP